MFKIWFSERGGVLELMVISCKWDKLVFKLFGIFCSFMKLRVENLWINLLILLYKVKVRFVVLLLVFKLCKCWMLLFNWFFIDGNNLIKCLLLLFCLRFFKWFVDFNNECMMVKKFFLFKMYFLFNFLMFDFRIEIWCL